MTPLHFSLHKCPRYTLQLWCYDCKVHHQSLDWCSFATYICEVLQNSTWHWLVHDTCTSITKHYFILRALFHPRFLHLCQHEHCYLAMKSHVGALSRALPMASKKAGFSELLFNRWTDENLSFLFCHRGSSHTSEQKSAHHIARDYRSQNCTKSPSLRRSVSKASLHSLGSICLIIRFCPCPPLRTLPGPVSGSITHCPSAKCYRTGSSLQDCR